MSQKCERPFAEALITGYLDGVLAPSDRRRIRLHLRRCAVCRRLLLDLRELRDTLLTARRHSHLADSGPISSAGAGYAQLCRPMPMS